MNRLVESFLIALLGCVCLVTCGLRLVCKVATFGAYPNDKLEHMLDDVLGSAMMAGYGIAHAFIESY